MPHDEKRIRQRAGFIEKEARRAKEFHDEARDLRSAGKEAQAKAKETQAGNILDRVSKTANNIKKLLDD